ncbi:MAG: gas vesicle structural protein GvpA [Solirubrobacterales bacterium]|nr:gas vesicle structural protein GvpA [Solirubrobacterales bacterium]
MAMQRGAGGGYVQRSNSAGLYEILDLILDKGLVIDVFLRVSLVGIELLTVDARIVIASVDTYLRFAEAVNRLDLTEQGGETLPGLVEGMSEGGAQGKTKGVLEGAKETLFGSDDDDDSGSSRGRGSSSSGRSRSGSSRSRSSSGNRRQKASTRGRS